MENQESKVQHLGKIRMKPGLTLFQLNPEGEVKEAEMDIHSVPDLKGGVSKKKSIIQKEGYRYCQALNIKNAKRKFGVW
jgi:hypothetical protein